MEIKDTILTISNYLTHEASLDEIQWLDNWTSESGDNQNILLQYKKIWDKIDIIKNDFRIEINNEWSLLINRIEESAKSKRLNFIKRILILFRK